MLSMGTFHNPPYRSPVPRSQTSASPPPTNNNNGNHTRPQSPKRKRPEEQLITPSPPPPLLPAPTAALRVDTSFGSDGVLDSGANSPRTKVAERFNRLDLRQEDSRGITASLSSSDSSQSPRKKLKVGRRGRDVVQTPRLRERDLEGGVPDGVVNCENHPILGLEIEETLEAHARIPPTPPPLGIQFQKAGQMDGANENDEEDDDMEMKPPPPMRQKRLLSPPPPSPLGATVIPVNPFISQTSDEPTTLTWREEEITGHEIAGPDDDGEGINGIGFRPTPAMAYARSQKRRQQVNEWKAREARDARQRRMDRRRGASSDPAAESEAVKRVVRFAASQDE